MILHIQLPKPGYRSTFGLLGYGLIVLVWMSLEDNSTLSVALLGSGLALLLITVPLLQRIGGQMLPLHLWLPGAVGIGGVVGLCAALMTVILMFFKTGWHGHIFADYPPLMMGAMLQRIPTWGLAGLLIGLAVALIKIAVMESRAEANSYNEQV